MLNCIVFISGKGTNLKAIFEAIDNELLPLNITNVISNNSHVEGLEVARDYNINPMILELKEYKSRKEYDEDLLTLIKHLKPDLLILAGWMHILSSEFVNSFPNKIINLHPALPNTFIGKDAIKQAWEKYLLNKITYSGITVHYVIPELDRGDVISEHKVNILKTDSLNSFEKRMKYFEKFVLIDALQKVIKKYQEKNNVRYGKVRNIIDTKYNTLCLIATDRVSAFDRHIGDIPCKGTILTALTDWWFKQTKHIINNHVLYTKNNMMIVQKCSVIPIEIVVRGYLTGNTKTSIWTMYKEGKRDMYGIHWPDGLTENQKIKPCITPTTKGKKDIPISPEIILKDKILTQKQWDFISTKALELFEFGQKVADEEGYILVDTKYEFGLTENGEIILIDEIHTFDSSRYWIKGENTKIDKDIIRNYVKKNMNDPYDLTEQVPELHQSIVNSISSVYLHFYKELTGDSDLDIYNTVHFESIINNYFNHINDKIVIIVAGSITDKPHVKKIENCLKDKNIYSKVHYASAHKQTLEVMDIINRYNNQNRKIVWVTVAGKSNALSGVVASNSKFPVIACPPFKNDIDMQVNINSTLQCPSKVPVMTILSPDNVSLCISRILNL